MRRNSGWRREVNSRPSGSPLARLTYVWLAGERKSLSGEFHSLASSSVELAGPAVEAAVSASPENRWVTADEIGSGCTSDGGRISPTVARILYRLAVPDFVGGSPDA